MFEPLIVAALISLSDPVGDATGNGTLTPPSAEVYRNLAPFDLLGVTVTDDPQLTLRIEMASLSNPFDLPLGFSLPVIEVYLSGEEQGRNELLPGSGMQLPPGQGWEVAVRLTGEQATAYRTSSAPGGVETAPVSVTTNGNELLVRTPYPRPESPRVYAVTGLYDLFGATPWRPLERQESPWAFSSESQRLPVVDLLAQREGRQAEAIDAGVLPPAGGRSRLPGAIWLVLMAVGLLVALAGVAMRIVGRRPPVAAADAGGDPPVDEPVSWESEPTVAPVEAPESRRPFTWDSSALLTEPGEEEDFDEELESEFGEPLADAGSYGREASGDAWQRPVPLPFRRSRGNDTTAPDSDSEPEMVRDEADEVADEDEGSAGHDEPVEAEPPATDEPGAYEVENEKERP